MLRARHVARINVSRIALKRIHSASAEQSEVSFPNDSSELSLIRFKYINIIFRVNL